MTQPPTVITPCTTDPDEFFDPQRMMRAAGKCFGCPLFNQCAKLGEGEPYGVWAGEVAPGSLREIFAAEDPKAYANDAIREGATTTELAEEFGKSIWTIEQWTRATRDELAGRPTRWQIEVDNLRDYGLTNGQIAERVGVSRRSVERYNAKLAEVA